VSHLENASNLLDQAADAEEKSAGQPNLLLIAAIIAVGVIIAVSIIVVVRRKRAKETQANSAVEQSLDASL
jgi:heme/copper-type cytochrome/quinol oxidase subunit 2